MSDMSLNHDLYAEANSRRHREAEALVRSRSHQRAARTARLRLLPDRSRRVRVMAVVSPMVALLALALVPGMVS